MCHRHKPESGWIWFGWSTQISHTFLLPASLEKSRDLPVLGPCSHWANVVRAESQLVGLVAACTCQASTVPLVWPCPLLGDQVRGLVICTFSALLSGYTTCVLNDFTGSKGDSQRGVMCCPRSPSNMVAEPRPEHICEPREECDDWWFLLMGKDFSWALFSPPRVRGEISSSS